MQELESRTIEFDNRVTKGIRLPKSMLLYAVAADHFVLAAKPIASLEDSALARTCVSVISEKGKA